ncbi:MAG: alpha/beta fold hydrolase [Chitinophagaceae bacterium]|nr:alpha/beta fold hydrolase [Chitinophagaceae bacterium]
MKKARVVRSAIKIFASGLLYLCFITLVFAFSAGDGNIGMKMTGIVASSADFYLFAGEAPSGVYKFNDGSYVTFARMQGGSFIIFSDGNIRGLRPASVPNTFEYGNAIAGFDKIEGRVQVEKKGAEILLKTEREEKTGAKMKFKEQDKEFRNGDIRLAGTLILPEGKGPFPCIVMTHGSGPEKREESRGLAYLFAGNGIAAFIYDKRGIEMPDEGNWKASFADYADDAIAAGRLMEKQKTIDNKLIGIFGHSQGGWVVPLAATRSTLFSYAIISAGNVVTPVEQHLYNGSCRFRQFGMKEQFIKEVYEFRLTKYEVIVTGNRANFEAALPVAKEKPWFQRTGDGVGRDSFWILNGYYSSDTALSAMKCPVLVIAGELDKYTDTKRNMALFQQIFEKSGNKNVTYKIFPSANHAYLETATGKLDETEITELKRFVPGYFDILTSWTKKVTSK